MKYPCCCSAFLDTFCGNFRVAIGKSLSRRAFCIDGVGTVKETSFNLEVFYE